MKNKIIAIVIMLLVALPVAQAQRHGRNHERNKDVTQLVSDLSQSQKKKLDAITEQSKARVSELRGKQQAVRDSIRMYMNMEGDQSEKLFPLFDKETLLQRDISREMYSTKVKVDQVLTAAQRKQLSEALRKN